MGHARALITLENPDTQLKIYHRVVNEGLSVRNTEALVREANFPVRKDDPKGRKHDLPIQYLSFKNNLNSWLNTKVDLRRSENGKGSIIISFNSEEEFNRISEKLKPESN
jgi:ParB family chromosome partitioning protein